MPGIDFAHAPAWLQWVIGGIAVIGAVVALGGFIRQLWRLNRAVIGGVDFVTRELPERLDKQDHQLERIRHEVLPNGGDSLADRSARNEAAITEILAGQEHIKRQVMAVKTTIARTDKKLDTHLAESAVILGRLEANGQLEEKETK